MKGPDGHGSNGTVHLGDGVGEHRLHRGHPYLIPRGKILHEEGLGHHVGGIQLGHDGVARGHGGARLGGCSRSAHKPKAHHVDEQVRAFWQEPVAHHDVPLNPHDEAGEERDAFPFKASDGVVDIAAFLKQVLAEKQERDLLPSIQIHPPLPGPLPIALQVGEVVRRIGVVKAHRRDIDHPPHGFDASEVLPVNEAEHVADILGRGLRPVGKDL